MKIIPQFSETAQTVLCKRYLRPKGDIECSFCHQKHETPSEMFERCSFGREDYYNLLASLDFLPGSPTLFNAGTNQGTFSSCFKLDVHDTMESIMDVATKSAMVQKWGGGVGYVLSEVRPYGKHISSTHGRACGPIAVMRLYQSVSEMITQGGKREGAQIAVLSCDHEDLKQFIHCKDDGKSLSTFNISVACTDEFMKKRDRLFDEICESAWKTGDPGIYFIDTSERSNPTPWLGKLTGVNPCGEVCMLDNESCNLGSINLSHMVELTHQNRPDEFSNEFNFDKLRETTMLATRYLDDVLDLNSFPVKEITEATNLTRKIGLGVMGWADTLALLHIHYDSDEAVELGKEIMKTVWEISHTESIRLAAKKGVCPAFGEKMHVNKEWGEPFRRNATTTCIAPAGTISILASCSSGIEPHYTLDGSRSMGDGTRLEDGLRGLKTGFVPHTAHEIDWKWHVMHQAAFQKYTDLAVSKTINMRETATVDDVRQAFLYAWKSGCKGITIYRDKSRQQQIIVDKGEESRLYQGFTGSRRSGMTLSSAQAAVESYTTDKPTEKRRKLNKDRDGKIHKFDIGELEGYFIIGEYPDGTPGEIFINASKQGSTIQGLLHCLAIVTSMALQYGVPLEAIASKMEGQKFEPAGMTKDERIPIATSIVDYIFRYIMLITKNSNGHTESSGMLCPACGALAIYEEGCLKCGRGCGWSRCG